jgi:hypothetical protein
MKIREKEKHHFRNAFLFVVTLSGNISKYLWEDIESLLQIESLSELTLFPEKNGIERV